MGYGDKLMAIGDAWKQYNQDPSHRLVAIGDGKTVDDAFVDLTWGLEFLAAPHHLAAGVDVSWIISHRHHRPYIDYAAMRAAAAQARGLRRFLPGQKPLRVLGHYIFCADYHATPAPIRLNEAEQEITAHWSREPFVILEPFIKRGAPPSKQWPVERFVEVARRLQRQIPVYQIGAPGGVVIEGLPQIRPHSFRESMAYLAAARLFIGPEGGLHHAAAAMGTKAVVIYGGFISPSITGYDFHTNLTGGATRFCGTKYGMCPHCKAIFAGITVADVEREASRLLA